MSSVKKEIVNYTVEREFLSQITTTELINNIIFSHSKVNPIIRSHSRPESVMPEPADAPEAADL